MNRPFLMLVFALLLLACQNATRADSIELINGDLLHGKVVSLDDVELRLVSDIHGAVIISRDKVAAIGFGERKLVRPAADGAIDGGVDTQGVVRRNVTVGEQSRVEATVPLTPLPAQDVVRQLRAQGLSAENITELQKALPMLKEPAARKYFDEKVKGLAEGTINVENIRKEAIRVRDEYRKTAKSLGPDGEKALQQALGGYLDILDKFIRDADPNAAKEIQPAAPSEGEKKAAPDSAKKAIANDGPKTRRRKRSRGGSGARSF